MPTPSNAESSTPFLFANDTVYYDQRQEYAEGIVQRFSKCLYDELYQRYESCDNDDIAWDSDFVRNDLRKQRDDDVGTNQYRCRRDTHTHTIKRGGCRRECRTSTQQ